jgi:hypothetical protein
MSVPVILILLKIMQVNCEVSGVELMFVERVGKGVCRRIDDVSFWIIVSFALSGSFIVRAYSALSPANQALCSSALKRISFVLLAILATLTICLHYRFCVVRHTKGTFYWADRFTVVKDAPTRWVINKDSKLKDSTVYWVLFKDSTDVFSTDHRYKVDILKDSATLGAYITLPRGYKCFSIIETIQHFEGWLKLVTYLVTHLFCSLGVFLAQRIRRTENLEAARLLIASTLTPLILSSVIFYAIAFTSKVAIPEETLSPTGPLKATGRIVIYSVFFLLLHIWCRISWMDRLAVSLRLSPLGLGIDVQKKA